MRRRRNLDTRRARTLDGYRNERVALGSIVAESPRHEELPDAEVPLVPMIYETTSLLRLVLGRGGFDG